MSSSMIRNGVKAANIFTIVATIGIAGIPGTASGGIQTHVFDLESGVDGGYLDNFGITSLSYDFGGPGKITNITFDFSFVSHGLSWNSEFAISIDTNTSPTFNIFASDYGAPNAPGVFSFSDSIDLSLDTTDGVVLVTLWETYDNFGVHPDSWVFGAGGGLSVTFIPSPGTMAVLGLGGLVFPPPPTPPRR